MKKKGSPVIVVLVLIIIVAIAGVLTYVVQRNTPSTERVVASEYFGLSSEDQVALVINGELSSHQGRAIDGATYILYEDVIDSINQRFYRDENKNMMIYALPTEIVETDLSQDSADYRTVDGQLYVAFDVIVRYTDMQYEFFPEPTRAVIRTDFSNLRSTTVTEDTQIRQMGGIKSIILTDVAAGTTLTVTDESLDNWLGVTTSDGYTGYIQKEATGPVEDQVIEHTSNVPQYTNISREGKVNMAFHQTTSQAANNALSEVMANVQGVNVLAPTWYFINDTSGNIENLSSRTYVDTAHRMGIDVWAVLNDFDGTMNSGDGTYEALRNTDSRRNIIQTVVDSVLENGINGINVDIEHVTEECAPHYLQFIRELSVYCRLNQLVLSVDNYVPREYTAYYDRKEQGAVTDYLVIMGYDEHYSGSEEAGSVASLPFVKEGIELTLLEVPAHKVINAIPFYTRIWTTDNNGLVESTTAGMDNADAIVAEQGLVEHWDAETGQNYAEGSSVAGLTQVWLEDEQSIEEKMKLIKEYDLAGVAEWKLGFERPAIWDIIATYLQ